VHTEHHIATTQNQQHLLFCQTSLELEQLEREARARLSPQDNGHRAAKFADGIVAIVRRKHSHVIRCPKCLIAEALGAARMARGSAVPQAKGDGQ
jgi:hypothetical protein